MENINYTVYMWEISTFLYKISTCVWKAYYLLATGLRALKWRRRTGTGSRTGRKTGRNTERNTLLKELHNGLQSTLQYNYEHFLEQANLAEQLTSSGHVYTYTYAHIYTHR